jgi:hypothetical protein
MAYTIGFFALWGIANSFIIPEGFRLVLVNTPADEKGVGSGVFNVFNNLSAVFGICVFQIIFSHKMQSIDIPAQDAIEKMGWSKEMLFVTFRNIFIFGGVLYALTAVFSVLAEGARFKDAGKTCPANSLK